jgi:HlyD family secretion protein
MKPQDLELYSEEVQSILSSPPNRLIRWGISVIFLVIILFFGVAAMVSYPDVIRTQITLTTPLLPAKIAPRQAGKIQKMLVTENQMVNQGEILLVLENPASYTEIHRLVQQIQKIKSYITEKDSVPYQNFSIEAGLGEVQNEYAQFVKDYKAYRYWIVNNYSGAKITQLNRQIAIYEKLLTYLDRKKKLSEQQLNLSQKKFDTEKSLYENKVIAPLEFSDKEKAFLQEKFNLASIEAEPIRAELQIKDFQRDILNLRDDFSQKLQDKLQQLQQSLLILEAKLKQWEENYLLKTPISGKISFFKPLAEQAFINIGENILTVIPPSQAILAYGYVNSSGVGKIKTGQKVKIYLDAYPKEEFGILEGKLQSKSEIAENGQYLVKVELPTRLMTNYRKELEFSQQMQGQAHIITQDLSLLQRVFYQLKYLFTRQ